MAVSDVLTHSYIQADNGPAMDGPSSSSSTARNEEDITNHVGDNEEDDDDDLDMDELDELEASLSRTTLQIKEPGDSA